VIFSVRLSQAKKFRGISHDQFRMVHMTRLDINADGLAKLRLNYLSQSMIRLGKQFSFPFRVLVSCILFGLN
jgi:hypothetical protein